MPSGMSRGDVETHRDLGADEARQVSDHFFGDGAGVASDPGRVQRDGAVEAPRLLGSRLGRRAGIDVGFSVGTGRAGKRGRFWRDLPVELLLSDLRLHQKRTAVGQHRGRPSPGLKAQIALCVLVEAVGQREAVRLPSELRHAVFHGARQHLRPGKAGADTGSLRSPRPTGARERDRPATAGWRPCACAELRRRAASPAVRRRAAASPPAPPSPRCRSSEWSSTRLPRWAFAAPARAATGRLPANAPSRCRRPLAAAPRPAWSGAGPDSVLPSPPRWTAMPGSAARRRPSPGSALCPRPERPRCCDRAVARCRAFPERRWRPLRRDSALPWRRLVRRRARPAAHPNRPARRRCSAAARGCRRNRLYHGRPPAAAHPTPAPPCADRGRVARPGLPPAW